MIKIALFLAIVCICTSEAWNRQNHFGNPCYLCSCFTVYTDRDVAVPLRPYAMAIDGYDTTEDRCLATCQRDKRCRAAVYGMVGGRSVFTCEFYERFDTRSAPVYTTYVNMYMKRASECKLPIAHLSSIEMIPADNTSLKRRAKLEKLIGRKNPFLG
uniref:Apple domain-containing protein n=1 Tax=Caenorhabditis japonica TaxID=281687 RepID=A0A8R1HJF4_CAEJA